MWQGRRSQRLPYGAVRRVPPTCHVCLGARRPTRLLEESSPANVDPNSPPLTPHTTLSSLPISNQSPHRGLPASCAAAGTEGKHEDAQKPLHWGQGAGRATYLPEVGKGGANQGVKPILVGRTEYKPTCPSLQWPRCFRPFHASP
eukprot:TRINITY_DN822_c0_g1_i1.p2 TRINITY_DN822_c0_g1~~TRINITY_DN822_c0_g1_i1.p2  ORF type:complete len:145 (+),score=11.04 TRINITY_DN822_c0_g1_i1:338-772(+)